MTELGHRLRRARREQDRTLREIAPKTGFTQAYLSQVETGRVSPSLAALKRIAAGYGLSIIELLSDETRDGHQPVLRREDRRRLVIGTGGVLKEFLVARQSGKRMEPICVTIEPGEGSKGQYEHAGEEFGLVLSGNLELAIEDQVFRVRRGDSFYFASTRLHGFRNPSRGRRAIVLWVITPPSF